MGAKKSQGSSPVLHEKRSKDSTKSKPVLRVRKSPVFARKIAKNLGKHIVFRGFLPWTAFLSTKHGLCNEILTNTILTNLLFAIIPQGYLPCDKLLMSLFMINPPVVSSFVAAGHLNLKYTTGGFILYLEDFNSTTLSGGLFALKRQ